MKLLQLASLLPLCSALFSNPLQDWQQRFALPVGVPPLLGKALTLLGNPQLDPEVVPLWSELEESIPEYMHSAVESLLQPKERLVKPAKFAETITNAQFPNHQLRMKKSRPEALGIDPGVNQYSGYLDILDEDKHLFYYFFESRNDPANDPVVLWLNGGPGCLSMLGLLMELGPARINATLQPEFNPHSWNANASVLFLDQPVGVGYSYSSKAVSSTAAAAPDVYSFLSLFFQKFNHLQANAFHIAGESYAGHYVPRFATEILRHPERTFNFKSVLIGNGITDPLVQQASYAPMACGKGGYKPVISDEECKGLEAKSPRCAALLQRCYDAQSAFSCIPASAYCNSMMGPYSKTGLNPYDIRKPCVGGGLCYDEITDIQAYLNLPEVQEALGAEVSVFNPCANGVGVRFGATGDHSKPFQGYVTELLDKGIPVLIYAGDKDYICNWLGNQAWTNALEYSDLASFAKARIQPWYEQDQAGEVKNAGNFTFLRVFDAGHMVPYDQPERSLAMLNTWLAGDYSFGN